MPDAATSRSEPHAPGGRSGGRRGVARDAGLRVGEVRDLPRRHELAFALADQQSQHLVATAVTVAAVGRMQRLNGREAVWLNQELLHDALTGLHAVPQPDRACPAAAEAPSPTGGGTAARHGPVHSDYRQSRAHVGDSILHEISDRLRTCARPGDTVVRLSGDRFAVLLTDVTHRSDGHVSADRILDILRLPFRSESTTT